MSVVNVFGNICEWMADYIQSIFSYLGDIVPISEYKTNVRMFLKEILIK